MKKQKAPLPGHDSSGHKFAPDNDGVCKVCGRWDASEHDAGNIYTDDPEVIFIVVITVDKETTDPSEKAHLN